MSTRRLLLAMPGETAHQRSLWERAFVATGLDAHTDICRQGNAYHRWNQLFPAEVLKAYTPAQVIDEQRKHALWRIGNWLTPKPYTHSFLDYEPKHVGLNGHTHTWQQDKIELGYDRDDLAALALMLIGERQASPQTKHSTYRLPCLADRTLTGDDATRGQTARSYTDSLDWVWMDCYLRSRDTLSLRSIKAYRDRITTHHAYLATLGKPIIPFIDPRYKPFDTRQARAYIGPTIRFLLDLPGVDTLGIWTDQRDTNEQGLSKDHHASRHADNLIASQEFLHAWIEGGL